MWLQKQDKSGWPGARATVTPAARATEIEALQREVRRRASGVAVRWTESCHEGRLLAHISLKVQTSTLPSRNSSHQKKAALKDRHGKLLQRHHEAFHPVWGQIMKTGYQNSRYSYQARARECGAWC